METMKQSGVRSRLGTYGSLVVIRWLCISSSDETRHFSQIWPWRSMSIASRTIEILTKIFYAYGLNLVILAWTGDELLDKLGDQELRAAQMDWKIWKWCGVCVCGGGGGGGGGVTVDIYFKYNILQIRVTILRPLIRYCIKNLIWKKFRGAQARCAPL